MRRVMWFGLGWLAVAVGAIGVVVPGLPSTIFFIFAASCFSRCSTRLERWILTRPGIGPLVSDYRAGLGMPRRAKQSAVISIALACSVSAWLLRERWWASLLIVVAGAVGAWWILRRVPTRADGRQRSA